MEVSWSSGVRIGVGVWGRADVGLTGGKLEGSKRQVGGNGWRGRWKLPPWLLFPGSCVRVVMKRTGTSCNKSVHRLDQILIYLPLPPHPPTPPGAHWLRLIDWWIVSAREEFVFIESQWGHLLSAVQSGDTVQQRLRSAGLAATIHPAERVCVWTHSGALAGV